MKNFSRNCISASIFCQLVSIILKTSDGHSIENSTAKLKLPGSVNSAVSCSEEFTKLLLVTINMSGKLLAEGLLSGLGQRELFIIAYIVPMETVLYAQGKIEESPEILVMMHIEECKFPSIEAFIRENLPDVKPNLVALPIVESSESFSERIENNSRSNTERLLANFPI